MGCFKPLVVSLPPGTEALENFRAAHSIARQEMHSDENTPLEKSFFAKQSTYQLRVIAVVALIRTADEILDGINSSDLDSLTDSFSLPEITQTYQTSAKAQALKGYFEPENWRGHTLTDPVTRDLMVIASKVSTVT